MHAGEHQHLVMVCGADYAGQDLLKLVGHWGIYLNLSMEIYGYQIIK
jgi:hypothetical protein